MEQPPTQPPSDDELLLQAEQSLAWSRNNYGGKYNDLADTAALVSLAASALVIARAIREQTDIMQEVQLPEVGGGQ